MKKESKKPIHDPSKEAVNKIAELIDVRARNVLSKQLTDHFQGFGICCGINISDKTLREIVDFDMIPVDRKKLENMDRDELLVQLIKVLDQYNALTVSSLVKQLRQYVWNQVFKKYVNDEAAILMSDFDELKRRRNWQENAPDDFDDY